MAPPPLPPEQAADSAVFRAGLRREKLLARAALPGAAHARRSALIERHLETALIAGPAGCLAFCWPIRGEFDARALVVRLLARGWQACMPVVVAPASPMIFRAWSPQTPMAADEHGIPVPVATAAVTTPDIVLLPLVAFDDRGYRLGYGGGYFDRTLAALPRPQVWGVGFDLARVADTRPGKHDIPMDAVVTDAGLVHFA